MNTNPRYVNQDLFLLKAFHANFRDRLVSQSDERAPFDRQVDLWWYAIGIGVRQGQRTPLPSREDMVKFNDGGILESDPWRISHLELLVLAEQGEEGASSAVTVIQTANEYALTGTVQLEKDLHGSIDPQMVLLSLLRK